MKKVKILFLIVQYVGSLLFTSCSNKNIDYLFSSDINVNLYASNHSLEVLNENFAKKNELSYNVIEQQLALSPERVRPFYEQAILINRNSNDIINYIKECKYEMISIVEQISVQEAHYTTHYQHVNKKASSYWLSGNTINKATMLKEKIIGFQNNITNVINDLSDISFEENLIVCTDDCEKSYAWEKDNFQSRNLLQVILNLNRIILQIRNLEFMALGIINDGIMNNQFNFNEISAVVLPSSDIVEFGNYYEAQIVLAALNTRDNPEIIVGDSLDINKFTIIGNRYDVTVENGVGRLIIPATSIGKMRFAGYVKYSDKLNNSNRIPFKGGFNVVSN